MENKSLNPKLDVLGKENGPMIVESLCMDCEEKGTTRILTTKIPYFKDVVIISFECEYCGNRNSEIQSTGPVQLQGVRMELKVTKKDLDRQVVKTKSALVKIPELDFEIPAFTQNGELSTIEGILDRAVSSLEHGQPVRKAIDPGQAEKIGEFIEKLKSCGNGEVPFTFVLDDVSGNSFLENPFAPKKDEAMTIIKYKRTKEQNKSLGVEGNEEDRELITVSEEFDVNNEVLEFPTECPRCKFPTSTNMKAVDIPHFKQVIIMSINCANCGERSNEVKSGAGIERQGKRIELKITDPSDLSRDVLKSDTCVLTIPELELELQSGTLGGRFTTIEGVLINIRESLETQHPFGLGDAPSLQTNGDAMKSFLSKLEKVIEGRIVNIHFILDDPAGNSYLQNVYAPDDDPHLKIEYYERTQEQNESLGISEELLAEVGW